MIDAHCHIDLYPNPSEIATRAERAGITTLAVTNLPSSFKKAFPFIRPMRRIRLALGMHPLLALEHSRERKAFAYLIDKTSYIGEVGLDFSLAARSTKKIQMESFQFILDSLQGKPKVISLHSRQAESTVLDMLEAAGRSPVVFHWYSGPLTLLERALASGHYFSVNLAMVNSLRGQQVISELPPNRVLTETDGPFTKVGHRPACPEDIGLLEGKLAAIWQVGRDEASKTIQENFSALIAILKS